MISRSDQMDTGLRRRTSDQINNKQKLVIAGNTSPVKKQMEVLTYRNNGSGRCDGGNLCCLCYLPLDVLLHILCHVSVIDYHSILSVCKCWRDVFLKCPVPPVNAGKQREQWFVLLRCEELYKEEEFYQAPSLYTIGKLGNLLTGRIHTVDHVEELCGTRLLLSRHGWLLLFSSSPSQRLFFYDPFSRARIDLPFMDVSQLQGPAFEISSSPTSSNCIVFSISCAADGRGFVISVCHRGASTWTRKLYKTVYPGAVNNVVFVDGVFYCYHENGMFLFTSADAAGKSKSWREIGSTYPGMETAVSYVVKDGDTTFLYIHQLSCNAIELKEPLHVCDRLSTNAEKIAEYHESKLRYSLTGKMILNAQDCFKLSSFNILAWCCCFTPGIENSVAMFRWHHFYSFLNPIPRKTEDKNWLNSVWCKSRGDCNTLVAWFEPTWVDPSSLDLDWNYVS